MKIQNWQMGNYSWEKDLITGEWIPLEHDAREEFLRKKFIEKDEQLEILFEEIEDLINETR